jgi:hypothetical protein
MLYTYYIAVIFSSNSYLFQRQIHVIIICESVNCDFYKEITTIWNSVYCTVQISELLLIYLSKLLGQ